MNFNNLEKLKALYDGKPDEARAAETAAAAELRRIEAEGLTKKNESRAVWLLDLMEYCSMPTSEPHRGGGFAGIGQDTRSEDEKLFRFGNYLQSVAAVNLPAGRKLGGKYNTGMVSADLLRSTGLEGAVPSGGGFLIDTGQASEMLGGVEAKSVLYPKTRKMALTSNTNGIKIPGIDETSRASTRWGGITSAWQEEGGTITASKPKFRNVELILNKLSGLVYITDEILEDSSILGEVVTRGFEQEFAFRIDDAILRGTGAGQPLGILNGPSLVSITGGCAATIIASEIIQCYSRMAPSSMANAEWFANQDILPTVMALTLGDSPIWLAGGSLRNQPNSTLLGKPIHFIEQASTIGTVGDLLFLDLSQYITISKGLKMASSVHVQFLQDEMVYRFLWRIDGQPGWHSSVTPYKGSGTLSPFVTIGTRA